jgi:hypothetical protein
MKINAAPPLSVVIASALSFLSIDAVSKIASFLSFRDLVKLNTCSKHCYRAVQAYFLGVRTRHVKGYNVYYPSLATSSPLRALLLPFGNLRKLTLVACRVPGLALSSALEGLAHSLAHLQLEMVKLHDSEMVWVHLPNLVRLDVAPPTYHIKITAPRISRVSLYRKALEDKCSGCGSPRPSYKCSACKFYAFCEKSCQVQEWNLPGHKGVCSSVPREVAPVRGGASANVVELVARACEGGSLREIDLAHFWLPNVVFPAGDATPPTDPEDAEENQAPDEDEERQPRDALLSHPQVLQSFAGLLTLRLLRCGLSDQAVAMICAHAPQLRRVDVSLNPKLTDDAARALAGLGALQDVRLRQNHRMSDAGMRRLASAGAALEYCDLAAGVRNKRDGSVEIIWVLSLETLQTFADRCPRLVELRGVWRCETPRALLERLKCASCLSLDDLVTLRGVNSMDWGLGSE